MVVEHPLDDWAKFKNYRPLDPNDFYDWEQLKKNHAWARRNGHLINPGAEHGFLYLRMTDLREFSNFMMDLAEQRKQLSELRDMIVDYYGRLVAKCLELGINEMSVAVALPSRTRRSNP